MNCQDAFDKAVAGVLKQGRPSYDPYAKVCQYRGPNGAKCAVGHLIPDDVYDSDLEYIPVSDLFKEDLLDAAVNFCKLFPRASKKLIRLLDSLQNGHDLAAEQVYRDYDDDRDRNRVFIKKFRAEAERTARKFNLKWKFS